MKKLLALQSGEITEVFVGQNFSWRKIPAGVAVTVPEGNQMTVHFGMQIEDGAELIIEQDAEVVLL
jgi:hypothetical protein